MTTITANCHIDVDTEVIGHDIARDHLDGVSITFGGDFGSYVTLLGTVDAVSDALTRAIGELVAIRAARAEAATMSAAAEVLDGRTFIGSAWR